jgi:hypothetical protein
MQIEYEFANEEENFQGSGRDVSEFKIIFDHFNVMAKANESLKEEEKGKSEVT